MTPTEIARNLIADHLAALTVDAWEIRDAGWTGDPGPIFRAVDDLCHHLDGILAPEPESLPEPPRGCVLPDTHDGDCAAGDGRTWPGPHPGPAPDTAGSGSNRATESPGAEEPHWAPERAEAKFGPRWRVGRSWGVTIVEQPPGVEPGRLAAVAQTHHDATRIVAALNAADDRELDRIEASVRGDQPEPGYELIELDSARGPGWMEAHCDCGWTSFGGLESVVVESWREHVATAHAQPTRQDALEPAADAPSGPAAGWDRTTLLGLAEDLEESGPVHRRPNAAGPQLRALLAERDSLRSQLRAADALAARLDAQLSEARAEAKQARTERDEACAELATERRNTLIWAATQIAAGHLWADPFGRWTAGQAGAAGAQKQLMVDHLLSLAADEITIPTTTEESAR